MGLKDIPYFDSAAYKARTVQLAEGHPNGAYELRRREVTKRQQKTAGTAKIICSTILLPFTGGLSGIGLVLGIRQRSIASRKLNSIQSTMKEHDIPMSELRTRDKVLPIVTTAGVAIISLGMLHGLEGLASAGAASAAQHGVGPAGAFATSGVEKTVEVATADPGSFVAGLVHGAETQAGQVGAVFDHANGISSALGDVGAAQSFDVTATPQAFIDGNEFAKHALPVLERNAVVLAAADISDACAQQTVNDQLKIELREEAQSDEKRARQE
jgi:hypothetical protein